MFFFLGKVRTSCFVFLDWVGPAMPMKRFLVSEQEPDQAVHLVFNGLRALVPNACGIVAVAPLATDTANCPHDATHGREGRPDVLYMYIQLIIKSEKGTYDAKNQI